jgi:hypothetical protein
VRNILVGSEEHLKNVFATKNDFFHLVDNFSSIIGLKVDSQLTQKCLMFSSVVPSDFQPECSLKTNKTLITDLPRTNSVSQGVPLKLEEALETNREAKPFETRDSQENPAFSIYP